MTTNFTTAVEIEVIGVITKDPEMSYTPKGDAKTVVNVYHHEYSGKDAATGKAVKATQWFKLTFWGKDAENVNAYAHVKDVLVAKGKLTFDKATGGNRMWTSNTDGTTKSTYEVSAHSVTIISMSGATAGAVIAPDDFEDTTGGAGFAPASSGQPQPQGGFTTPAPVQGGFTAPAPVYAASAPAQTIPPIYATPPQVVVPVPQPSAAEIQMQQLQVMIDQQKALIAQAASAQQAAAAAPAQQPVAAPVAVSADAVKVW